MTTTVDRSVLDLKKVCHAEALSGRKRARWIVKMIKPLLLTLLQSTIL
jgi:hypothetical protein